MISSYPGAASRITTIYIWDEKKTLACVCLQVPNTSSHFLREQRHKPPLIILYILNQAFWQFQVFQHTCKVDISAVLSQVAFDNVFRRHQSPQWRLGRRFAVKRLDVITIYDPDNHHKGEEFKESFQSNTNLGIGKSLSPQVQALQNLVRTSSGQNRPFRAHLILPQRLW